MEARSAAAARLRLTLPASHYEEALPANRVRRDANSAVFNAPLTGAQAAFPGAPPYATYAFTLEPAGAHPTLGFTWDLPPSG